MEIDKFEKRLLEIETRNKRVEENKAWETSWIRRISIAVLTYTTIVIYHIFIDADHPFLVSLVPVFGFIISTMSLKFIRKIFEFGKTN